MKLRTLKRIITLVAAFAVLTTGGVTYAAWEVASETVKDSNTVTAGTVTMMGFDNATALTVEDLLPYDQASGAEAEGGTNIKTVTVNVIADPDTDWKVSVEDLTNELTVHIKVTGTGVTSATYGSAFAALQDGVIATGTGVVSFTIHFSLHSDDPADMGESITYKLTLAADNAG